MYAAPVSPVIANAARTRAFTLIELLVVIGLVAGLTALFLGNLGSGGRTAALQSAQAAVANLVNAAQTRAMATGQAVRVMVCVDPASVVEPRRYLRCLVVEEQVAGTWRPLSELYLPDGIYMLPGNFPTIPAGLFRTGETARWSKFDGGALRSTALRSDKFVTQAVNRVTAEKWVYISLAPSGTTMESGALVLATGVRRPPGDYAEGESSIELRAPEMVRGLKLSAYGIATLIDGREDF